MDITKDIVKHVAHLARMDLKTNELDLFASQLKSILDFIGKLEEVSIDKIAPTSHILPFSNVLRNDDAKGSLDTEQALKNAPQKIDNFFGVPKVIE